MIYGQKLTPQGYKNSGIEKTKSTYEQQDNNGQTKSVKYP